MAGVPALQIKEDRSDDLRPIHPIGAAWEELVNRHFDLFGRDAD